MPLRVHLEEQRLHQERYQRNKAGFIDKWWWSFLNAYKITYAALGENYFASIAGFFSLGSPSAYTCSTLTVETPKQCMKFIQS